MPRCGRPLGIRFDQRGRLLVADAYLGIHRVNVSSGKHCQPASAACLTSVMGGIESARLYLLTCAMRIPLPYISVTAELIVFKYSGV